MSLDVVLRYRTRRPWAPGPATLRRWARLAAGDRKGELGIRVVGSARAGSSTSAGAAARTRPTSCPFPAAPELGGRQIGDIVVCAPVVAREAREQGKALAAHWAHMIVHGTCTCSASTTLRATDAKPDGRPRARAARAHRHSRTRTETEVAAKGKSGGWLRRLTQEGPRDRAELVESSAPPRAAASSTPTRCR